MSSANDADIDRQTPSVADTRLVWDLPVRVFHWVLVLAFVGAYVTNRLGIEYFRYHLWFGYAVTVLVAFRIVWGVVGTRHARFWNFIRDPGTTLRYGVDWIRGRGGHYPGHNPLGGLMVVALLILLFIQAVTGLVANDEIFNTGPLHGYISAERSLELTSWHRWLFDWILAAVAVHVLAVIVHLLFKKENLVKAMLTGRKPARTVPPEETIGASRTWLAVLIAGVLGGVLAWLVSHAPEANDFFDSF